MPEHTAPELLLPRPLINQLLHIAQSAPAGVRWGFISARGPVPTHCHPIKKLDADCIASVQLKIDRQGETLFALYRVDSAEADVPDLSDIEQFNVNVPLLLGVSLGTKGVLQLHGWQISSWHPVELGIGISET
ncbi:MAG TPA: hypothetical protein VF117_00010 [Gammaproteobacteria bacterium]